MSAHRRPHAQRGAALLMAMIIVTLVASLAAAMVWQQWRTVQIETAERSRAQASWILTGALDWSELILREDARADRNKQNSGGSIPYDGLDEPWATPLAEARLSTFLAADENYTGDGPEAFLSGDITDATSRFNLMNLIEDQGGTPTTNKIQVAALKALCNSLDVSVATADKIVQGMLDAELVGRPNEPANPPIRPARVDQLIWFGIDPGALKRLEPYLAIIDPTRTGGTTTKVNLNTASSEVIAALLGIDRGDAERLVQSRKNKALRENTDVHKLLPGLSQTALQNLPLLANYRTSYFEVRGRMRIGDRVLEQKALVYRDGNAPYKTTVLRRDDTALKDLGN